eukprot:1348503-Amorphochlora_amoeboformis.AAC.1
MPKLESIGAKAEYCTTQSHNGSFEKAGCDCDYLVGNGCSSPSFLPGSSRGAPLVSMMFDGYSIDRESRICEHRSWRGQGGRAKF